MKSFVIDVIFWVSVTALAVCASMIH